MADRRVIVSRHALERARLRFQNDRLTPGAVRAEIEEALAAGREGLRLPPGLTLGLSRNPRLHDQRFVWTADLRRCYLVKRARSRTDGKAILLVITALANGEKEQAA